MSKISALIHVYQKNIRKRVINFLCFFIFPRSLRHRIRENLMHRSVKIKNIFNNVFPHPDCKQIPIYIIVFNSLTYLKKLLKFLESCGYENIHIIDNCSTYPPLLKYLSTTHHHVHQMDRNYGYMVFYESGKFDDVIQNQYYVLTDPDIVPGEDCPENFMDVFWNLLQCTPDVNKVGFALRIDDLPDGYKNKNLVLSWEANFWTRPLKNNMGLEVYDAKIDTTFALYRPKKYWINPDRKSALRVAGEYSARHLPWYQCVETPEQEFYKNTSDSSASWIHKINTKYRSKK